MVTLFSHRLTTKQHDEIVEVYGEKCVYPTADIQKLWSQVPTAISLPTLSKYITPIISFIKEESSVDDVVFVQGEFGMTTLVVQWCFAHGRVPIYATTERKAVEVHNEDGTVEMKHIFEHAGFREYEKL